MTFEEAKAKAERLTAQGVPTVVEKNLYKTGGYQTRNIATDKVRRARYDFSTTGKARRTRYDTGKLGKARHARHKLGHNNGHIRLNRVGERFRQPDWVALQREVKRACFVCRRRRRKHFVDHDHDTQFVRAPVCHEDNVIEGLLKKIGVVTFGDLMLWAIRMGALRTMPQLSMTESEIKAAKKRKAA